QRKAMQKLVRQLQISRSEPTELCRRSGIRKPRFASSSRLSLTGFHAAPGSSAVKKTNSLNTEPCARREIHALGVFRRREIRDRARVVYRHRRLLQVAASRAEQANSRAERDRTRN